MIWHGKTARFYCQCHDWLYCGMGFSCPSDCLLIVSSYSVALNMSKMPMAENGISFIINLNRFYQCLSKFCLCKGTGHKLCALYIFLIYLLTNLCAPD